LAKKDATQCDSNKELPMHENKCCVVVNHSDGLGLSSHHHNRADAVQASKKIIHTRAICIVQGKVLLAKNGNVRNWIVTRY
jgi:hypothetical protein